MDADESPMVTTLTWADVFRKMDHWEEIPKLREIHRIAGTSTKPTGLARRCSPYVAHLMVNPRGRVQLFHHFHHNVDEGLNDRTDEVWAFQGGSSMAHAVAT